MTKGCCTACSTCIIFMLDTGRPSMMVTACFWIEVYFKYQLFRGEEIKWTSKQEDDLIGQHDDHEV